MEALGWGLSGAGAGAMTGMLGPALLINPFALTWMAGAKAGLAAAAAGSLLVGWFGTEGYGGQNWGPIAQGAAFIWGIRSVKHDLAVLDNALPGSKA